MRVTALKENRDVFKIARSIVFRILNLNDNNTVKRNIDCWLQLKAGS